jgi:hypothetical protein
VGDDWGRDIDLRVSTGLGLVEDGAAEWGRDEWRCRSTTEDEWNDDDDDSDDSAMGLVVKGTAERGRDLCILLDFNDDDIGCVGDVDDSGCVGDEDDWGTADLGRGMVDDLDASDLIGDMCRIDWATAVDDEVVDDDDDRVWDDNGWCCRGATPELRRDECRIAEVGRDNDDDDDDDNSNDDDHNWWCCVSVVVGCLVCSICISERGSRCCDISEDAVHEEVLLILLFILLIVLLLLLLIFLAFLSITKFILLLVPSNARIVLPR